MFIVINKLKVQPGMGDKLIERFTKSHGLEDSPGFIRFQLLQPVWAPGELDRDVFLSMTEWESREAFEAWLKSDSFKQAHKGGDNTIFAGPPEAIAYEPAVSRLPDDKGPRTKRTATKLSFIKQIGLLCLLGMLMLFFGGVISGCEESPAAQQSSVTKNANAITFTDDTGRTISLDKPAERIVAGGSFVVELLMTLDHPPVLRPDVPERKVHPESCRPIPTFAIQHGSGPQVESVAAARPDLVILHSRFAPFGDNISQTLGVPVALLEIKSVDDVVSKLKLFGRITGKMDKATAVATAMKQELDTAATVSALTSPRVLALFGTPEAFYAYRETSYLGSMLERLGAENLAAGRQPVTGLRSVAPLDLEQAIGRSPQIILVIPHGPPGMVMKHLASHPAWSQMQAVRNKRVHMLDEVLFSSNPGPRAPQALRELKELLYPSAE